MYKAFEQYLQYITSTETDMKACTMTCAIANFFLILFFYGEFSSRPPDHHLSLSGGPTEVLVDWGHRTTCLIWGLWVRFKMLGSDCNNRFPN